MCRIIQFSFWINCALANLDIVPDEKIAEDVAKVIAIFQDMSIKPMNFGAISNIRLGVPQNKSPIANESYPNLDGVNRSK